MPELPEVETVCRQLAPLLEGRRVKNVRISDEKLRVLLPESLSGATVESVRRTGKEVLIVFRRNGVLLYLAVHLRMTGRLIWNGFDSDRALLFEGGADWHRYVRARFELEGGVLFFSDVRRFGTFKFGKDAKDVCCSAVDPVGEQFTPQVLGTLLRGSAQAIKVWLLRQDRLVGIGNIYASEILFDARIHPGMRASAISSQKVTQLHGSIQRILNAAIENAGTSFSDFLDASGEEGGYQNLLKVYGREGERCERCRRSVVRIVQAQRSTFFCPGCQKLPSVSKRS